MLCSTIRMVRPGRHALDEFGHAVHVLVAHALGRFVEQHQLGLHRQRGRDFERALAAVGQVRRSARRRSPSRPTSASSSRARSFERLRATSRSSRNGSEVPSARCRPRRTFSSTVRCGNTAEIWNERMMPRRAICAGRSLRDVLAVEQDGAGGRLEELGEQVEAGRLAGAVGADQRVDRAAHAPADRPC